MKSGVRNYRFLKVNGSLSLHLINYYSHMATIWGFFKGSFKKEDK